MRCQAPPSSQYTRVSTSTTTQTLTTKEQSSSLRMRGQALQQRQGIATPIGERRGESRRSNQRINGHNLLQQRSDVPNECQRMGAKSANSSLFLLNSVIRPLISLFSNPLLRRKENKKKKNKDTSLLSTQPTCQGRLPRALLVRSCTNWCSGAVGLCMAAAAAAAAAAGLLEPAGTPAGTLAFPLTPTPTGGILDGSIKFELVVW